MARKRNSTEIGASESSPKRTRTNGADGTSEVNGTSDANGTSEASRPGNAGAEDGDFNDDAQRELALAREMHAAAREAAGVGRYAEAGVVESITLVDFMCHEHLHIDLGPNMNFIIGHNGSGKSAILTALTTCLGGKASNSGRGSSVKELVRQGRPQATVTVRLKNRGADAYRHDLYGDTIIIERKILADGGGSYALKGRDRQTHGRKREDLDAVTDHFGLAIDNPMNVLTQDVARQFLANATNEKLYELFMKGIELHQLEADHNLLGEQIVTTRTILQAREKDLEGLRARVAAASKMYDATRRARDAHDSLDALKAEMAWAQVQEVEEARDTLTSKVARQDDRLETLRTKIGETETSQLTMRAEIETIDSQRNDMSTAEEGPLKQKVNGLKSTLSDSRADLSRFITEQRECHGHMTRQDKLVDETQKSIDQKLREIEDNAQGIRLNQLRQRRSDLEENIGNLRQELDGVELQHSDAGAEASRVRNERDEADRRLASLQRDVDRAKEGIRQLQAVAANATAAFHPKMDTLLRQINSERRWQDKPIGPIGMTMKLKHPEWSDIIEVFFGKKLNGFVVFSYEDKRLLLSIMKQCRIDNCPVSQGTREGFRTAIKEPAEEFLTILRAIEWSDESVKKQLIIAHRPESALLIRNRREADATVNCDHPPENSTGAFAIDDRNPTQGWRLGGGVRGASSSVPVPSYQRPKRLTSGGAAELERQRQVERDAQEKLRSEENVVRLLTTRLRELETKRGSLSDRRTALNHDLQRYQRDLQKVKDDLEVTGVVDDGQLRGLQEALEQAKEQREMYKRQYDGFTAEKREMDAAQARIQTQVKEAENELAAFRRRLDALQPRRRELENEIAQIDNNAQHYNRQLREHSERRETLNQELMREQRKIDEYTQIATTVAPERVDVRHSTALLERKLNEQTRAIEQIERRFGGQSVGQIAEELEASREAYRIASVDIAELTELNAEMETALQSREESRNAFRKLICIRTRHNFVRHLGERRFLGRLSFDHRARTLDMRVVPADGNREPKRGGGGGLASANGGTTDSHGRGRDNKGLSGGEKSFTTICLLLSIWEAMGCPIRALDEFDVFMDSVNRGISMRMMIDSANASVERQFLLITPNDMGGVKPTPTTKILRLEDPVRGVTQRA